MRLVVEHHALTCSGEDVPLPPRLFQILLVLLENAAQVVPQEELRSQVWPNSFVEDAAVSKNVSTLRAALRGCLGDVEVIRTVPKRGYQFMLPVVASTVANDAGVPRDLANPPLPEEAFLPGREAESSPGLPPAADLPAVLPAPRLRNRVAPGLLLLAVLVLGGGAIALHRHRAEAGKFAGNGPPSIAILHLRNLSNRPDLRWMGVALGESLANDLSRGNGLRLTSTADVAEAERDLKTTDVQVFDPASYDELTKRLGSDFAVTGTYLPEGDHIRVDLQLRNVHSGEVVSQYGQVAAQNNLQQLVSDAIRDFRNALHLSPLPPSLTDPSLALADNPEALHHLAEGLRLFRAGEAVAARPELEAAVAASPRAPLALAALARDDRTLSLDVEAGNNARLALAASDGLPLEQKLLVQAQSYDALHDYVKSAACWEQLHTLAPQNIDYIYYLAFVYVLGSKPDKTLATLELLPPSALTPQPRANLPLYQAFASQEKGDYRTQLLRSGEAIKLAEAQSRRGIEFRALLLEGSAWNRLGDLPHALADDRRAEQVAEERGDSQGVTAALLQQGADLADLHDPASLPTLQRALTLAEAGGDLRDEAALTIELGNVYTMQYDYPNAVLAFRKAVAVNRQVHNAGNEAIALGNLPLAEIGTAPDDALRDAKAALALAQTIKNADMEASAWRGIGVVEEHLGETTMAREDLTHALDLSQKVGRAGPVEFTLTELALLEMKSSHLQEARDLMTKADAIHAFSGIDLDLHTVDEASLSLEEGNVSEVETRLTALLTNPENSRLAVEGGAVLADSLLRQNKVSAARNAIDKAVVATRKLPGDPDNNAQALLLQARVLTAEGNFEAASTSLQKLRTDATRWKDAWLLAEITIAQAEMDHRQGKAAQARAELLAVRNQALRNGYGLIASRCDMEAKSFALLQGARTQR